MAKIPHFPRMNCKALVKWSTPIAPEAPKGCPYAKLPPKIFIFSGFIKANEDLSNLEVLVLGINPDSKNPYEEDVIKAYWGKWLQEMKVKRFEIRGAELPSNMEKVIKDFINKGK